MRKILFTVILAACTLAVQAQDNEYQVKMTSLSRQTVPQQEWEVAIYLDTEERIEEFVGFDIDFARYCNVAIESYTPGPAMEGYFMKCNSSIEPDAVGNYPEKLVAFSPTGTPMVADGKEPLFTFIVRWTDGKHAEGTFSPLHWPDGLTFVRYDGSQFHNYLPDVTLTSTAESHIGDTTSNDLKADVYTLDGRLLRRAASLNRLPAGIYIVNGKKTVVK